MNHKISVSIGIPAYNEGQNIGNLLDLVEKQNCRLYKLDKIYVANDGSTDKTVDIVKKISKIYKNIHLLDDSKRMGVRYRTQEFLKINKSEVLIFLDADTIPRDKNTIDNLIKLFVSDKSLKLATANLQPVKPIGIFEKMLFNWKSVWSSLTHYWNSGNNIYNFRGVGIAIRKDYSKKIKIPKNITGATSHYLYLLAKKLGYTTNFSKNSIIMYKLSTNYNDYLLQVNRGSKDGIILKKLFPSIYKYEYDIPKVVKLKSLTKSILQKPFQTLSGIIFDKLIKLSNKNRAPSDKNGIWKMAKSTKAVVFNLLILSFMSLLNPLDSVYASSVQCDSGTTMNFVAHEDDDLLFLNPDIQNDIRSGRCVITVYLTAGDANNDTDYWNGRENGEKAAYSIMNLSPNFWAESDAEIPNHPIPVFNLISAPKTSLIFVRVPDGNYDGNGFSNNNYQSLQKLWQGNINSITTVNNSSSYTKQNLINTLTILMNKYNPDIIRTQNFMDGFNSNVDHSDHYATAYLTSAASSAYDTSHILVGYFDYEINQKPQNLFSTDITNKRDTFINYAQYDPSVCQTVDQCNQNTKYSGWFAREYIATTIPSPSTPTPEPSSSPNPSPTSTSTPQALINIAPYGTGYRWSKMTSPFGNSNQVSSSGVNDKNITTNIALNGGPDDNVNAYEGAGVIWSSGQNNITRIQYLNGDWESNSLNGVFSANIQLQYTTDGSNWINSGANANPNYSYDSPNSSNKTYIFNVTLPNNILGVRVVGQVRTTNALSWYANAKEITVESSSTSSSPTPSSTPIPTNSPTPTPTSTPTPSPLTNIAPNGIGYRWSKMTSQLNNTNQVVSTEMNDNNTAIDVRLNGGPDDNVNAYEGAGVIWSSGQNGISEIDYINGSWETNSLNGAFSANFQLQYSLDGITWVNSNINPTSSYNYDNPAVSGKTYIFIGNLPNNIMGVRVVGQVRTTNALSWYANTKEIIVKK